MPAPYFAACKTPEEVKKLFRQLALRHHPDHGGDSETMRLLIEAYHAALKHLDGHTTPRASTPGRPHVYHYDAEIEQSLIDKINALLALKMQDVEIWLIGRWIWTKGNTRPYKDQIKALGFTWHHTRQSWYFAGVPASRNSSATFEELFQKYGLRAWTPGSQPAEQLAA